MEKRNPEKIEEIEKDELEEGVADSGVKEEIKADETSEPVKDPSVPPRAFASSRRGKSGGEYVLAKEKIIIFSAMAAFALILLSVILAITFCGKGSDDTGDGGGGLGGHKHKYEWSLEYVEGRFDLVGRCSGKDCDMPDIVEREVSVQENAAESKHPTCLEDGKIVYEYVKDGVTVKCDRYIAKVGHKINGFDVSAFEDENGNVIYDGKYVNVFNNTAAITCGKTYSGHYTCSVCGEMMLATVYVPHIADEWEDFVSPTCTETGIQISNCKFCKMKLDERVVAEKGHFYKDTLTKENGKFVVVSRCGNNCGDVKSTEVSGVEQTAKTEPTCGTAGTIEYSYVKNGTTLKYIEEFGTASQNHVLGGKLYTELANPDGSFNYGISGVILPGGNSSYKCGTICDGAIMCEECKLPVKAKVNLPAHSYVMGRIDVLPTFADDGEVTVKCENRWCKDVFKVTLGKIEIGKNAEITEVSTEKNEISVKYRVVTEYGIKVEFTSTFPHGGAAHDYTAKLSYDDGKFTLMKVCSFAGCTENVTKDVTDDVVETDRKPVTCATPETVTYTYEKDGISVSTTVYEGNATGDHILNGVIYKTLQGADGTVAYNTPGIKSDGAVACGSVIDAYFVCSECNNRQDVKASVPAHSYAVTARPKDPTWDADGMAVIKCQNTFCTDAEMTVVLPKISVGENTELVGVWDVELGGTVKYTYVIDDNYSVSFEMHLDKGVCETHSFKYEFLVADNTVILKGSCDKFWCSESYTKDVSGQVETSVVTPATCTVPGTKLYKYSGDGIEAEQLLEYKDKDAHVINGKVYTLLLDENGRMPFDTPGIIPLMGAPGGCGEVVMACFRCEQCFSSESGVGMVMVDAVAPAHSYSIVKIDTDPSVASNGTATVKCGNNNCKDGNVTVTLPKIVIGENAEEIEGTNKVKYTYVSEEYGVTFELEIELLS